MTRAEILDAVRQLAIDQLHLEPAPGEALEPVETSSFSESSRLLDDLQLDSVQLLSLAVAIEDHFRVAFSAEDEEGIVTIGDLVDVVVRRTNETTPP